MTTRTLGFVTPHRHTTTKIGSYRTSSRAAGIAFEASSGAGWGTKVTVTRKDGTVLDYTLDRWD